MPNKYLFWLYLIVIAAVGWRLYKDLSQIDFVTVPTQPISGQSLTSNPLWPCYWSTEDEPRLPGFRLWIPHTSNIYLQAWSLVYEGKVKEAKSLLEQHYEYAGREYDLMLLGNLAYSLGDQGEAVHWWKEAGQTSLLLRQAKRCLANQQYELAQGFYDIAAQIIAPIDSRGYAELLNYYCQFGSQAQYNFALEGLLRSTPDISESYEMQMLLGKAYDYQKQPEDSLKHYLTALNIKPDDERATYEVGRMIFNQGDHQTASQFFLSCLHSYPSCYRAKYYLGEIAFGQKDYQQAEHWFSQVEEPLLRLQSMAKLRLIQNNLPEARRLITEALTIAPPSVYALKLLALICSGQEDRSCEISAYQHVLQIDPGDSTAQNRLKSLLSQP